MDPLILARLIRNEARRRVAFLIAEKSMKRKWIGAFASMMGAVSVGRALDSTKSAPGRIYLPDPENEPNIVRGVDTNFEDAEFQVGGLIVLPSVNNVAANAEIVEIMGLPTTDRWPKLTHHPEYNQLQSLAYIGRDQRHDMPTTGLQNWYNTTLKNGGYSEDGPAGHPGEHGFDLLSKLLDYDPESRLTAEEALQHPYFFANGESPGPNCFEGVDEKYPHRKVSHDDNDPSIPGAKRAHVPHDAADRQAKRHRD